MPTIKHLTELFRAISTQDIPRATAIASQICDSEENKGHRSAARSLRGALAANGTMSSAHSRSEKSSIPGVLSTALVRLPSGVSLSSVVLSPNARVELEGVVQEWSRRDELKIRGLTPRSKILFHGPPGCGKSLSAKALATELELPAYLVRFDSVIGAYLGQTAIHLRQIFQFAETTPCLLLLDELDALGKRRGHPLDVGELDRIVIALMQELEHSRPLGIIVATSNLATQLDDALWRRFDLSLMFSAPTKTALKAFSKNVAQAHNIQLSTQVLGRVANANSFAEAEAIVIADARRQALAEK